FCSDTRQKTQESCWLARLFNAVAGQKMPSQIGKLLFIRYYDFCLVFLKMSASQNVAFDDEHF
ncbi:MAG: hypothetical protein AAF847_14210, partial [Bacteroidota bacterium]